MFLWPRLGLNCLTRGPSGVLARDAGCRLLIFRSAGDPWQADLQITPKSAATEPACRQYRAVRWFLLPESSLAGVHRAFAGLVLGRRRIRTGLPHIFRSVPVAADLQAVAADLQSAAVAMASAARLRSAAAELQSAADRDRYLSKPLAAALPFRAIVLIDG